ncbi:MAG: peptidylprolyl isomerase [Pseudomonadota bacterium]
MTDNRIIRGITAACAAFAGICAAASAQVDPSSVQAPRASGPTANIPQTYAGPSSSVAAVVNDTVVTTYDVQQRMKLMIISSGGQVTPQMLGQLQTQALRDLVQEKLKLLEAEEWEMKVEDREVEGELQQIAAQSGTTVPQLEETLIQQGVSPTTLREQIKSGLVWPRLVQARFRNRVRVSEDEVEQTLTRMREDASKEQFLVSEICIPVADSNQIDAYYQGALQLIEQMRRGVPFAVVAQQFSACTSAAAGGDMGWVRAGELPAELDAAVRELPPGAVTNPLLNDGAFMILALRDKREAAVKGEETFTFAYAGAPLEIGRNAARQALEKLPTADACGGRAQRQDLGQGVGVALLESVTLEGVDERFQSAVEDLGRHELSPIIEADGALHAVYVCEKDEGLGLPSRDALEDRIFGRQLTRIAQQYLRDIERDSLVDVRLKALGGPITGPRPPAPPAGSRG